MNVKPLMPHWLILSVLIAGPWSSAFAQADANAVLLEQARACAEQTSRLERLNCFDAIFQADDEPVSTDALPALWHAIERQESARDQDDVGLLVHTQGEDVLMSVPALGTTPPRPILVMACEKLITRFQLHLPTPLNEARVDLQLTGNGMAVQQQWRARDGGQVLSGGRGLPAIETLRQLLNANEVTMRSDVAMLDGLRFDVSGLREEIQPLRNACRW